MAQQPSGAAGGLTSDTRLPVPVVCVTETAACGEIGDTNAEQSGPAYFLTARSRVSATRPSPLTTSAAATSGHLRRARARRGQRAAGRPRRAGVAVRGRRWVRDRTRGGGVDFHFHGETVAQTVVRRVGNPLVTVPDPARPVHGVAAGVDDRPGIDEPHRRARLIRGGLGADDVAVEVDERHGRGVAVLRRSPKVTSTYARRAGKPGKAAIDSPGTVVDVVDDSGDVVDDSGDVVDDSGVVVVVSGMSSWRWSSWTRWSSCPHRTVRRWR